MEQQAGQGACLTGGYRIPGGFAKLLGHGRAIQIDGSEGSPVLKSRVMRGIPQGSDR